MALMGGSNLTKSFMATSLFEGPLNNAPQSINAFVFFLIVS